MPPCLPPLLPHALACALLVSASVWAQEPADVPPAADTDAKLQLSTYVLGVRWSVPDLTKPTEANKLRPTLGFRYGRWRIGSSSDADRWLALSGSRRDSGLAYELTDSERISTSLSLRVHNITVGESTATLDKGRHTLRGRAQLGYQITPHWSAALELTHDLLDRGDGITLGVGLSRGFALDERSLLTLSSGLTWGSATHWRTANADQASGSSLSSGWGSVGLGAGYRYAITPAWAWYANVGSARAVGQVVEVRGSGWTSFGQAGLLYFGKF